MSFKGIALLQLFFVSVAKTEDFLDIETHGEYDRDQLERYWYFRGRDTDASGCVSKEEIDNVST